MDSLIIDKICSYYSLEGKWVYLVDGTDPDGDSINTFIFTTLDKAQDHLRNIFSHYDNDSIKFESYHKDVWQVFYQVDDNKIEWLDTSVYITKIQIQ